MDQRTADIPDKITGAKFHSIFSAAGKPILIQEQFTFFDGDGTVVCAE